MRGLFFDKPRGANWGVPWHQDLAIAVKERAEVAGFQGWSVKSGVTHVHPPADILERMVAMRIHLDACDADNGALRLIPGSHRDGKLDNAMIERWVHQGPCAMPTMAAGDLLLMRPLLLHASSKARDGRQRRVIHVEFAAGELPGGLEWFERV